MTRDTQSQIAAILTNVYLPALSFLAIGRRISIEVVLKVWVVPVLAFTHILVAAGIGYAAGIALQIGPALRSLLMTTTAFPNTIALPLALLHSLSLSLGDRAPWLDVERGEGIILTYAAAMILGRWTLGFYLLKPKPEWTQSNWAPLPADQLEGEDPTQIEMDTYSVRS
eukprot:CAMPEP_0201526772 /NCGR_PEP_ID=MMETSP0161_2-20130828/32923_1 /ASSEMBLY_ACC=CAM_ASM_000251 /TAXON_ID=180227 /ORGANISM="Neoparamoeba aestuarina, Strain SoJaBio B1-5/56/2" /LENGTH=168 /DNA_ID=CAMNT_0047927295 /DNA_START=91 /DNA_END=593 /DNA_ORIENTATION=+